jgi:hypothetical protein
LGKHTDELVEFEKPPVEVQQFRKNYRIMKAGSVENNSPKKCRINKFIKYFVEINKMKSTKIVDKKQRKTCSR